VGKGSGNGTTRGDRKRNARRERLRGLLPRDGAVIGIDLAEDKQAIAVIDHDVRVLARDPPWSTPASVEAQVCG
jgi:transposase